MKAKNYKQARKQAQANANYFGVSFCVFSSTDGNVWVERDYTGARFNKETFYPQNESEQKEDKNG